MSSEKRAADNISIANGKLGSTYQSYNSDSKCSVLLNKLGDDFTGLLIGASSPNSFDVLMGVHVYAWAAYEFPSWNSAIFS